MDLVSTLFPALIGYFFLKTSKRTRLTIPHESGYHLFFKSALVGYGLVGVPYVSGAIIGHSFSSSDWLSRILDAWDLISPFELYVGAYVVGIVLGLIWLLHELIFYDETTGFIKSARERGDQLGALIAEALGSDMFIEISLRNRKSYIGYPLSMKNGRNADIELSPLQSGYRDEETQELVIDTDYTGVILDDSDIDASDTRVIISSSEVVSAKPFDPRLYRKFQEVNPGTSPLPGS